MKTNIWEVVRNEDGTFDLFHKGELLRGGIPEVWLPSDLAKYGFCGTEYEEIRRQLEHSGNAKIVLS